MVTFWECLGPPPKTFSGYQKWIVFMFLWQESPLNPNFHIVVVKLEKQILWMWTKTVTFQTAPVSCTTSENTSLKKSWNLSAKSNTQNDNWMTKNSLKTIVKKGYNHLGPFCNVLPWPFATFQNPHCIHLYLYLERERGTAQFIKRSICRVGALQTAETLENSISSKLCVAHSLRNDLFCRRMTLRVQR